MSAARAAAALLALVVAVAFAACGEPEVSASAHCDEEPYVYGDEPASPRASLVLVDLSSNAEPAREAILAALRPTLKEAIWEGGVVRLVVSGGSGEQMKVSSCLDGKVVLRADYNNPTRESNERHAALAGIEGNVSALLAETQVAKLGDVTNLIAQIPNQLRQIGSRFASGERAGRVVLISDLNSPLPRGDCMSVRGLPASATAAAGVVERCLALLQYRPLPAGVELQVVQPQLTGGDGNASRMGKFLADSLCIEMSERKGQCPGYEA